MKKEPEYTIENEMRMKKSGANDLRNPNEENSGSERGDDLAIHEAVIDDQTASSAGHSPIHETASYAEREPEDRSENTDQSESGLGDVLTRLQTDHLWMVRRE